METGAATEEAAGFDPEVEGEAGAPVGEPERPTDGRRD